MRQALFLVILLMGSLLAGCAEDGPGAQLENGAFSVSRVVRFHVDNENLEKAEEGEVDPYDFISSTLVVTVGGTSTQASALTVAYTDRDGQDVERPLSDFTTQADLAPGAQVMIEDANLTSGATLKLAGVEVASRARGPVDWWNVGGYPIGFAMEPGSTLKYTVASASSETLGIVDLDVPDQDLRIDAARASFGMTFAGELELSYAEAAQTVQAEAQHTARPLAWRTTGQVGFPILLEARGTDVANGTTIDAGLEVLPETGIDYDAHGTMWWNHTLSPVRLDLEGGEYDVRFDAIAWLTGMDEIDSETFSCAGKTRADACRPTEWSSEDIEDSGELEPESDNLDGMPWNVDAEALANLTRLLAEDLRPGDEMRFDLDLDERILDDAPDAPEKLQVKSEAVLRAVGYESVTVGAGTFDALKVVERVSVQFEIGEFTDEDGLTFGPLAVEESLAETDFWLHKETFVPLRIEQRMPFDFQRVMRALLEAAPADAWEEAGIEAPDPESFEFTLTTTMSLELTQMTGTTQVAPWALFTAFHGIGMAAAAPFMGLGMGGSGWAEPAYGDEPWDDAGWYEEEMERPYAEPVEPAEPGHLVLESAAPLSDDGLVKDYRVVETSADLWYFGLEFRLDGEYLGYAWSEGHAPAWCLVDEALDACMEDAGAIAAGDLVRIQGDASLQGRAFEVVESHYDYETETFTETTLVVVTIE